MSSKPREIPSSPAFTPPRPGRHLLRLIILALVLWGGIAALGVFLGSAEQNPAEATLHAPVKAAIVVTCVVAFLALWSVVLRRPWNSPDPQSIANPVVQPDAPRRWSGTGLASLVLQLLVFGSWLAWYLGWQGANGTSRGLLAFFGGSLLGSGIASVLALIALSDPLARRGKLLGILTLALAVVLVVVWFRFSPQ